MTHTPCPNDAMIIPVVAEEREERLAFRFCWCWSCSEWFAFEAGSGQLIASFSRHPLKGWRVFRHFGSEDAVAAACRAAANVSF